MESRVAVYMDLLGNDFPYATTALSGKHALVCGASKGIGAATAKMMAKAGANVTLCARNETSLGEVLAELKTLGTGDHSILVLDLEKTASIIGAARHCSMSVALFTSSSTMLVALLVGRS